MSWNWSRGMICIVLRIRLAETLLGKNGQGPLVAGLQAEQRLFEARQQVAVADLNEAGCLSKVLSTTLPSSSLRAKCR